jgi:multiple sugar transport system permease protein
VSLNTQYQVKWNDLMAASSFSCLPLIILFVCFQRYFIAGMTSGAVKS